MANTDFFFRRIWSFDLFFLTNQCDSLLYILTLWDWQELCMKVRQHSDWGKYREKEKVDLIPAFWNHVRNKTDIMPFLKRRKLSSIKSFWHVNILSVLITYSHFLTSLSLERKPFQGWNSSLLNIYLLLQHHLAEYKSLSF